MTEPSKLCCNCKIDKSVSEFYVNRRRGKVMPHSECKECMSARYAEWITRPGVRERRNARKKQLESLNRPYVNTRQVNYARKIREEMLTAYGHACECCGETDGKFLAVDHKFGGGTKARREGPIRPGVQLHLWLRKKGFPTAEFRLLCHNCNMARGLYGSCPHENAWMSLITPEVQLGA